MRPVFVTIVLILSVLGFSQGELAKKSAKGNGSTALRVDEMKAAIGKYEGILRRVLDLPKGEGRPISANATPATRTQFVKELNRLFELCRPSFKYTPRAVVYDATIIAIPKTSPERGNLEKLVKWGALGRVDPFVVGKSEALSLEQFGDTLGLFLIRIADLSHVPSSKFSPYMMKDG